MEKTPAVILEIDLKAYTLKAVKSTCYRLAERVTAQLAVDNALAHVSLWPKNEMSPDSVRSLFLDDLIDQDLRESIKKETEPVSQLILAQAFSKTSLIGD